MYQPEGLGTELNDRIIRGNPKEIAHANTAFRGTDLLVVNPAAVARFESMSGKDKSKSSSQNQPVSILDL